MSQHTRASTPPPARAAWKKLLQHQTLIKKQHLRELFTADPGRAQRYIIRLKGLYVDFSRHFITDETIHLLTELATESGLSTRIKELFSGANVNTSEQRPALHTALRMPRGASLTVNGEDVCLSVHHELDRMESFVTRLHAGDIRGYSGKSLSTIVNIGIGGSDLGPRLACEALKFYHHPGIKVLFLANIDPRELDDVLEQISHEQTLFIVSSKSFSTQETLTNARTIKAWLTAQGCTDLAKHFAAITAHPEAAQNSGIEFSYTFRFREWVGGRYSLWSAIGLPLAAAIGMENFRSLLSGAHEIDQHFQSAPFHSNLPVILGLLDIWYINFFNSSTLAVIPYEQGLERLAPYLAQLFMESNGKNVNLLHEPVNYSTGAVVWGGVGTNAQHAFMQLLHQGTHLIPVDLLAGKRGHKGEKPEPRQILLANCIAQGQTLMEGTPRENPAVDTFRMIPGNKPSTTLIYDQLTPQTLGKLLALYEHRTFVQAAIWNTNPFDQWGVELGKKIAVKIKNELVSGDLDQTDDSSTRNLIQYCLSGQES